jgi:hypothetical protein
MTTLREYIYSWRQRKPAGGSRRDRLAGTHGQQAHGKTEERKMKLLKIMPLLAAVATLAAAGCKRPATPETTAPEGTNAAATRMETTPGPVAEAVTTPTEAAGEAAAAESVESAAAETAATAGTAAKKTPAAGQAAEEEAPPLAPEDK